MEILYLDSGYSYIITKKPHKCGICNGKGHYIMHAFTKGYLCEDCFKQIVNLASIIGMNDFDKNKQAREEKSFYEAKIKEEEEGKNEDN